MLEERVSPFREAAVVACSLPGRLIEVDAVIPHPHPVTWNAWSPGPDPSTPPKRKRRRSAPLTLQRRAKEREPWMTGLTRGPTAWEALRLAAAHPVGVMDAAAHLPSPNADVAGQSRAKALARAASRGSSGEGGGGGGAEAGESRLARLRYRPGAGGGCTLFGCQYDILQVPGRTAVPGVMAYDSTTLLPLGPLVVFDGSGPLASPEGICASSDHLFVVDAIDCTVARIGIAPTHIGVGPSSGAADGRDARGDTAAQGNGTQAGGGSSTSGSDHGGGAVAAAATGTIGSTTATAVHTSALPYRGHVLATYTAGESDLHYVAWGMALGPDRSILCVCVDVTWEERAAGGRDAMYSRLSPPGCTGNVLCVPLACLALGTERAGAGEAAAGGEGGWAQAAAAAAAADGGAEGAAGGGAAAAEVAGEAGQGEAAELPYMLLPEGAPNGVLRRPSGLVFAPDGASVWVTSYDGGVVQLGLRASRPGPGAELGLGPGLGPGRKSNRRWRGEVLRVIPAPSMPPPPLAPPAGGDQGAGPSGSGSGSGVGSGGGRGGGAAASGGRRRGGPDRLLAWDLCYVPTHPPAPSPAPTPPSSTSPPPAATPLGAPARRSAVEHRVLCATLHADGRRRLGPPSALDVGAMGVVREGGGGGRGGGGGGQGSGGEGGGDGDAADEVGGGGGGAGGEAAGAAVGARVEVVARWVSRHHAHANMAAVC
ncbi:hypothetical protein HYH03_014553 [Edaphochlamys debaryana]|uniref:Uncharacterized protein n=1 Tax=Edaphochlamys debaryana TaxID=47281 RepID=A0A835XVU8_9CHLO|nr:hypothetical protein HYH03_014553 [Edaphochlamys debaryana]|eukprot:KAG2486754.1 hypothetical protein HYH03_014553 [Edaphochlamys debaryana]